MKKLISIILITVLIGPVFADGVNKEAKKVKEATDAAVLMGTVVDQSTGEALPGAQIKISGIEQAVYTDLDGNFEVDSIKAGTYEVEVSLISYEGNKIKNLVVSSDKKSALKVELRR